MILRLVGPGHVAKQLQASDPHNIARSKTCFVDLRYIYKWIQRHMCLPCSGSANALQFVRFFRVSLSWAVYEMRCPAICLPVKCPPPVTCPPVKLPPGQGPAGHLPPYWRGSGRVMTPPSGLDRSGVGYGLLPVSKKCPPRLI